LSDKERGLAALQRAIDALDASTNYSIEIIRKQRPVPYSPCQFPWVLWVLGCRFSGCGWKLPNANQTARLWGLRAQTLLGVVDEVSTTMDAAIDASRRKVRMAAREVLRTASPEVRQKVALEWKLIRQINADRRNPGATPTEAHDKYKKLVEMAKRSDQA
jgi:hypothetical protein